MNLRNTLNIRIYCAVHPDTELTLDLESSEKTASNAYEVGFKLTAYQCRECAFKYDSLVSSVEHLMKTAESKEIKGKL